MIFYILQIVISILLIGVILLQVSGGGVSPLFGGGSEVYRSKQNIEKFLMGATIFLALCLAAVSIVLLFPNR